MEFDKIDRINEYLENCLWMDFELCNMNGGRIDLYGFLDEAGEDKIKIIFKQPYMVICVFSFTYEGNGTFISLVTGEEAYEMNKKYGVIQGNQIFRLTNTNINSDMYIIARELEVDIID